MGKKNRISTSSESDISESISELALELLEAFQLARDCAARPIEFAVEISRLRELGLNNNHLRWLLKRLFIQHVVETSLPNSPARQFHEDCGPYFTQESCFFLTAQGFDYLFGGKRQRDPSPSAERFRDGTGPLPKTVPVWDVDRQELRFGGKLVKRYKLPSKNQVAVLNSFEEDGWPARIDDPVKPLPGSDSRRRLNDTVKALNKNQKHKLLHFRSDGSGEGILWELSLSDEGPVVDVNLRHPSDSN